MMFCVLMWALVAPSAAQEPPPEPPPAEAPAATSAPEAPSPAGADDDAAKRLYTSGAALYEEGRYEQAIAAFRQAYDLSKRHALLKNIANAQERLNDLQGAVDSLNTYRIYADASEKGALETRVRVLEDRIARDREARIAAEAAALEAAKSAPPPAPAAVVAPERRSNPVKWVLVGTGAALAGGFGAATALTYGSGQSAADAGDRGAYDAARTLNNVSGALALAGGGVLAVGIAVPGSRPVSGSPSVFSISGRF